MVVTTIALAIIAAASTRNDAMVLGRRGGGTLRGRAPSGPSLLEGGGGGGLSLILKGEHRTKYNICVVITN